MKLDTAVLDYSTLYKILHLNRDSGEILVNAFLAKFYSLYDDFRDSFTGVECACGAAERVTESAALLEDFIRETGGSRAAAMLSEFRKHAAISDNLACARMKKSLFEEIDAFRDVVVSMFA